jgi:PAS domain S-box-containing protein
MLESIEESMHVLEDVLDALPSSLAILDERGVILAGNARWHLAASDDEVGLDHASFGTNYLDVCERAAEGGNADASIVAAGVREVLARRSLAFEREYAEGSGASMRWFRVAVSALGGQPGAVVQHIETSEVHRQELARHEALAHFRAVFEGASDTILIFDDVGRIVSANPAASVLFGRRGARIVGRAFRSLIDPLQRKELTIALRAMRERGEGRGVVRLVRGDGARLEVEYVARANFLLGRHLAVLRDVTSARAMEAQLRQSQKMEALGQLTGGIAHDFNNLLTVIVASADMLLSVPVASEVEDVHHGLVDILRAANRGAELVRKLMAFGRQEQLQLEPLQLDLVIADLCNILRRVLPEWMSVQFEVDGPIPVTLGDATAVQQILLNLATNARDAMEHAEGELRVKVCVREDDLSRIDRRSSSVGAVVQQVHVTVADNGVGMASEVLSHIFEPFYTTKPEGEGTGLGMSMVYGLMQQMRGNVSVDSRPGSGTTVLLRFPVADVRAEPRYTPSAVPVIARGGAERLLLVEDDAAIRRLTARVLRGAGYEVTEADSGNSAALVLEQHKRRTDVPFDLVISDVVMPDGSGSRVLEAMQKHSPTTRLLWVTGYVGHVGPGEEYRAPSDHAVLHKPWTPAELLARVRRVLDTPPSSPSTLVAKS